MLTLEARKKSSPSKTTSTEQSTKSTHHELESLLPEKISPTKLNKQFNIIQKVETTATGRIVRKGPQQIKRTIDDPQHIVVQRRSGEGAKPIFDRDYVTVNLNNDEITEDYRKKRTQRIYCSSESSSVETEKWNDYRKPKQSKTNHKRSKSSPTHEEDRRIPRAYQTRNRSSSKEKTYELTNRKSRTDRYQNSRLLRRQKSRSRSRETYRKTPPRRRRSVTKSPPPQPSTSSKSGSSRKPISPKVPYFLDEKREEDRLKQKHRFSRDERSRTSSRRSSDRSERRRHCSSRDRESRTRRRSTSRSRSIDHSRDRTSSHIMPIPIPVYQPYNYAPFEWYDPMWMASAAIPSVPTPRSYPPAHILPPPYMGPGPPYMGPAMIRPIRPRTFHPQGQPIFNRSYLRPRMTRY